MNNKLKVLAITIKYLLELKMKNPDFIFIMIACFMLCVTIYLIVALISIIKKLFIKVHVEPIITEIGIYDIEANEETKYETINVQIL